jgi:hypothetical protein
MNVLAGALKSSWNGAVNTESCVRGNEFEQYMRITLFPRETYDLFFKTDQTNKNSDGLRVNLKHPDYKFKSKGLGIEFYVEAKFRARFQDQILEWCKFFELRRYQEIDNVTPVVIAIGLGGKPSLPERVFLVPVKHIKFVKLYPSLMQKYEIAPGDSISERFLKGILA